MGQDTELDEKLYIETMGRSHIRVFRVTGVILPINCLYYSHTHKLHKSIDLNHTMIDPKPVRQRIASSSLHTIRIVILPWLVKIIPIELVDRSLVWRQYLDLVYVGGVELWEY